MPSALIITEGQEGEDGRGGGGAMGKNGAVSRETPRDSITLQDFSKPPPKQSRPKFHPGNKTMCTMCPPCLSQT